MTRRIWELDALRGLCILAMAAVHLVYDLELYGLARGMLSRPFLFLMDWGGVVFVLLSGCCATLSRNSLRRGFLVFGCGLLVSAVTVVLALTGFGEAVVVYFGVLHCLGTCMVLWSFLRKLPRPWLTVLGIAAAAAGAWLRSRTFGFSWLIPLGFVPRGFVTADYFPLLPHLGFFLLGALLGEILYPRRKSLLPGSHENAAPVRFLCLCGQNSLLIYLLHQPVITGLLWLLRLFI